MSKEKVFKEGIKNWFESKMNFLIDDKRLHNLWLQMNKDLKLTEPVVSIELKGYFKKGEFVIYKSVLRAQVIDELETGLIEIKAIGYGVLEVDQKHLELE